MWVAQGPLAPGLQRRAAMGREYAGGTEPPYPARGLYQRPPISSPSLTSAQHTAVQAGGLPPLGGREEFSFQRKYKGLLSLRASLVPSLWVLRKISGGNSSVHPHLSPETPAGHTPPLRSRSHSRSHSHSLTLPQTHTHTCSFPHTLVLETQRVLWLCSSYALGAGRKGVSSLEEWPAQPRSQGFQPRR